ncbi:MAG: urease accessory protein [Rhodospirillales bacterium]|nr:urease accessory protein [Rhodospirillales bacterium]MBT4005864.1 urease accessory protein [Rhodospirillales bacterium]MBT5076427.1 urease accessory protein [Rhodospirillales bacterium]MBT5114149.1 urease accessory protein [Rhodospirillales bacterium]MBT5672677.1 urease accessory protein [Rhodospirillales bacterium]
MLSVLGLGFLIGMKHAIEADHVAAVASLATRARTVRETTRFGIAWGLGHTITLFIIGSVVLAMDMAVPKNLSLFLEFAVGLMLVGLGIDVVVRFIRKKAHFHAHAHDGSPHFHAHRHSQQASHDTTAHRHAHPRKLPVRALIVGLMHGLAGSAALVLLALSTIESVWMGVLYILLFGFGSIIGMAILSCAIAVPLRLTSNRLEGATQSLSMVIGALTIIVGASIIWRTAIGEGLFI